MLGGRLNCAQKIVQNGHIKLQFANLAFNPNSIGGRGQNCPYDERFSEKCPSLHNNKTTLIKQLSLFDTALVMTKT